MAAFGRLAVNIGRTLISQESRRCLNLSSALRIKEIRETRDGKNLIVEGVTIPSPRVPLLVKNTARTGACPVCAAGLDVKHTDVLILSQFLRSDGCMLPRRVTGLCKTQQKRIGTMVAMAQKAGLMPNIAPANSRRDPKRRKDWKKFNTYFDEKTIKAKFV
ncbi:large ribosomal subunit protein mL66 [Neodiprion pinetum]|uniref:Large ribosomal subunit protein mL66 n=1 Tax=Neodiprion lecontei TaxID=441921 RepID=A0A6J0BG72_NEOLC|nr:28S ribosomal protein S18a, mitochondrial [Neodiprion lecontei]XP_046492365.1 28S ribosomal protein S18a, mitochondrial [Neodiprion pinetum]